MLKLANRVDLKGSHHKKKNFNYVRCGKLTKLEVIILHYIDLLIIYQIIILYALDQY